MTSTSNQGKRLNIDTYNCRFLKAEVYCWRLFMQDQPTWTFVEILRVSSFSPAYTLSLVHFLIKATCICHASILIFFVGYYISVCNSLLLPENEVVSMTCSSLVWGCLVAWCTTTLQGRGKSQRGVTILKCFLFCNSNPTAPKALTCSSATRHRNYIYKVFVTVLIRRSGM